MFCATLHVVAQILRVLKSRMTNSTVSWTLYLFADILYGGHADLLSVGVQADLRSFQHLLLQNHSAERC